ncbi:hypothetical protein DUNSADRAFT_14619 [Dunaliella salina]|uniref:Encoded protein n=1 Tax=Dunaliella salina TaxID=3046 RepID=A0ABQ7H2H7_DUNSA|nr:hypothetical protein DUNSADRAFT_14619 [Dunaliella salina]|eukprot:KAF5841061.1 hypothetical protein DUNSADRAFT_14619 [Dunaliella salina]
MSFEMRPSSSSFRYMHTILSFPEKQAVCKGAFFSQSLKRRRSFNSLSLLTCWMIAFMTRHEPAYDAQ